jgi:dolichyl-phosphate beta-glucosyltransferase
MKVLTFPENRGKGRAVRAGMTIARGHLRLMADADGATPIADVKRLEAAIEGGADLAVGSRARPDGAVVRHTRLHRRLVGNAFNLIVRALGVWNVVDTQCGFKLFRGPVADDLFTALRTEGYGFDVEILLLAQQRRYRIAEVPINWADQPGSKVGVLARPGDAPGDPASRAGACSLTATPRTPDRQARPGDRAFSRRRGLPAGPGPGARGD